MTGRTEPAAESSAGPEAITRRLLPWLVPYLALCLLGGWRLHDWPASGLPFGSALGFPAHAWHVILVLECLPGLALLPGVWKLGPVHAVTAIAVILTLSTDLMLFTYTMIRGWDLPAAGTAFVLILKVGFDAWILGRVSERRETYDDSLRRPATAPSPGSDQETSVR